MTTRVDILKPRRHRVRALIFGVSLALVAFELALQLGAYLLWQNASRESNADDSRRVVLCVGDSFTYGLGASDPARSYPAQLQRALDRARPGAFHVVNGGVPGQSTADVLRRLPNQLATHHPEHVVVLAGYNDRWKKPDRVDPATLAGTPAPASFPWRLRTLELIARIRGALDADAPDAPPPPSELYGSWQGDSIRVRFGSDGVCIVAGAVSSYVVDGTCIVIGDGESALRFEWERHGDSLHLIGAALSGGRAELTRSADDAAITTANVGRRVLEGIGTGDVLDLAAVERACGVLRDHPEDSPLWWSVAAAAGRGVGADIVLETVATALEKLPPGDAWRAGLLRIRSGLLESRDPDGALAAVVEAALVDGQVEAVTSFVETRAKEAPEAAFERAIARLEPNAEERARLDAMFERVFVPEDRLVDVLADHLAACVRICADAGARTSIATYPQREPLVDRAIRAGAMRANESAIDLTSAFTAALAARPGESLFVMDGHCNDAGYALVADTVARRLLAAQDAR